MCLEVWPDLGVSLHSYRTQVCVCIATSTIVDVTVVQENLCVASQLYTPFPLYYNLSIIILCSVATIVQNMVCILYCTTSLLLMRYAFRHAYRYAVTCVSVHPSGKLALSVGKDRTVRFDLVQLQCKQLQCCQ